MKRVKGGGGGVGGGGAGAGLGGGGAAHQLVRALGSLDLEPPKPVSGYALLVPPVLAALDSEHSKKAYRTALLGFLTWWENDPNARVTPFGRELVMAWKDAMRDDTSGVMYSAASLNLKLAAVKAMAREAAARGVIDAATLAGVQGIKAVKASGQSVGTWLSVEQVQKLLDRGKFKGLRGERDYAILALMVGSGLRRDEVAGLCMRHLQRLEDRPVLVDVVGKGNAMRSVPVTAEVERALQAWDKARYAALLKFLPTNDPALHVFETVDAPMFSPIPKSETQLWAWDKVVHTRALSGRAIGQVVEKHGRRIGVKFLAPHDLRRTFAHLAEKGGAPLSQIQKSLGHADVSTTSRYLNSGQDLEDAPGDAVGRLVNGNNDKGSKQ